MSQKDDHLQAKEQAWQEHALNESVFNQSRLSFNAGWAAAMRQTKLANQRWQAHLARAHNVACDFPFGIEVPDEVA